MQVHPRYAEMQIEDARLIPAATAVICRGETKDDWIASCLPAGAKTIQSAREACVRLVLSFGRGFEAAQGWSPSPLRLPGRTHVSNARPGDTQHP